MVDSPTPSDSSPAEDASVPSPKAPTGAQPRGLMGQWNDWLAKPENKSMLLQTSINLLQPAGPGQSTLGQIGEAVGSGFEARDQQRMQNLEVQKAQAEQARIQEQTRSESELRGAQTENLRAHARLLGAGGPGAAAKDKEAASRTIASVSQAHDRLVQEAELEEDPTTKSELLQEAQDMRTYLARLIREANTGASAPAASPVSAAGASTGAAPPPLADLITEAQSRIKTDASQRAPLIAKIKSAYPNADLSVLEK